MELRVKIVVDESKLRSGLEDIESFFKGTTTSIMKRNVDSAFEYSWLDDGGLLEDPDSYRVRGPESANRALVGQIQDLYAAAWARRYQQLQSAYKSVRQNDPRAWKWLMVKSVMAGKPSPWNPSQAVLPVGQATWGIMTGYLKRSISEAFSSTSSLSYMKIDNLAIRGMWETDLDAYPVKRDRDGHTYMARITRHYAEDLGILDDEDYLTQLSLEDLYAIGERMLSLINKAFVGPLVRDLREMDIEISAS